uniref:Uncharacterized protein n=1 Tax=Ascaris lumbricoides TaxID=6252 RepID=A0A9J2PHG1_ASCLU
MRGTRIRGLSNALALARPFNRRVHFKSATKGAVLPGQRSLIGCGELRARTRLGSVRWICRQPCIHHLAEGYSMVPLAPQVCIGAPEEDESLVLVASD